MSNKGVLHSGVVAAIYGDDDIRQAYVLSAGG